MPRYSFLFVEPSCTPPFKSIIRYTRGEYAGMTEPMGPFGFRYARFCNLSSDVLVPLHDLTPQTKAAIADIESTRTQKGTP